MNVEGSRQCRVMGSLGFREVVPVLSARLFHLGLKVERLDEKLGWEV